MKLTTRLLKRMIKEEMDDLTQEQQVDEGIENLTPENLQLAIDMLVKMSQEFAPVIAGSGLLAAAMKAKEMLSGGKEVIDGPQYYDDEEE
ncbi:hypothetical protein N9W68_01195 [Candidatus Pelagibacter bacterium]|nr:hypothetical protein [Candidatus Pelagibacter bacterium]